jgi:dihydrolipoamide dehydrogenase
VRVEVPDIGDFTDVPVIEILVKPGDTVAEEQPLVTLESDKATMEVPSPAAGTVETVLVKVGDTVSQGTPIVELAGGASQPEPESEPASAASPSSGIDVVVVGAGPGGYTAAFRAADLGLSVVLVERYERLGGVCLNVGCIPSKALLHLAKVIGEAEEAKGVSFGEPEIDLDGVRAFKDEAVTKLTDGLVGLAKRRKVDVRHGEARFTGANTLDVGGETIEFAHAIIAVGSSAATLPFLPDDERIVSSTGALELPEIPQRLLVIGGGIIGLEMATVYDALGADVTVVELEDQLIPGCDPDLVKPLHKRIESRYAAIRLGTGIDSVTAEDDGLHVGDEVFDRILVAVGRRPNGATIDADKAGVTVTERGFIEVDEQQRTNVSHIFAIGDVVGEPMLAHKATHEGVVAAEVIAGQDVSFDARAIPSVAYTDPEVAWAGLTETKAKADGTPYEKAVFPWAASGRALGIGRPDGSTKLIVDPETRRVLGAGVTGAGAGELIAEVALAIEMGAVAEDIALTIHPHPTLSETIGFAAEVAEGTVTDIVAPRK